LIFAPDMEPRYGNDFATTEYRRVILHEFGHAVGLIHEHQRPKGIQWNEDALCRHAAIAWGWNCNVVREQIIRKEQGDLIGTVFDVTSIMEYPFPPGLATLDGHPFQAPANTQLSALDKVAACLAYPRLGVPPIGQAELIPDAPAQTTAISTPGQFALYRFRLSQGGACRVETAGIPVLIGLLDQVSDATILAAAESPAGSTTCTMALKNLQAATDYYVQVRARKPLTDSGNFTIALRLGG